MKYRAWVWMAGLVVFGWMRLSAAEIRVFSEFSRLNPSGEVVSADTAPGVKPREILSPGVARNAFASFHVLVEAKPEEKWSLYIGENPDKALRVTVYREVFVKGIPTQLEAVAQPVTGAGAAVIWLDLWVDKKAAVQRVKIEPELQVEGVRDWITYPMEVRVLSALVPDVTKVAGSGEVATSDAPGLANLAAWLCKTPAKPGGSPQAPSVAQFLARNAAQDYAMLQTSQDVDWLWLTTKATDRKAWCKSPSRPAGASSEWYLRVRDRLNSH